MDVTSELDYCTLQLTTFTSRLLNPLKPQSNGPLYSNTVTDGWAVTFGTARRGEGQSPLTVLNVTAHPSTDSVPTFIIRCGTFITCAH